MTFRELLVLIVASTDTNKHLIFQPLSLSPGLLAWCYCLPLHSTPVGSMPHGVALLVRGYFYHVNLNPLAVVLNGLFSLRLTSLILRINLTVHTHAHVHNIQCPKNETLRRLMIIERKITTVYSYCCTKSSSFSSFADKKVDRGLWSII